MTRWMVAMGTVLLVGAAHAATLYRWVDPHGVVTYQNTPPPSSAGHVRVIRLHSHASSPSAMRKAVRAMHPVVLYRAPHCAPCRQVSAYLHRRRVPFRAVDVSRGQAVLRAMKIKTGSTTVPTIMVGKQVLVGYIPAALKNELTAAGYLKGPGG